MASVSGTTSSLGNTSLRGYGGLVSGMDRDELIEAMTSGTTTKITNQQNAVTKLEWKQEAFRSISDKIIGLDDNYFAYSSPKSLKNASIFARNQITTIGDSDVTKFVTATGSSDMIDNLSVKGVKQVATSASRRSAAITDGKLTTGLNSLDQELKISNLRGSQLRFGTWNEREEAFDNTVVFTLPSTYKDEDGNTRDIDYTGDPEELAKQLNLALENSNTKLGEDKISDVIKFEYDKDNDQMKIITQKDTNFVINPNCTALSALGYQTDEERDKNGISFEELNENTENFSGHYIDKPTTVDYFNGKKVTFNLNGNQKEIELITAEEYKKFTEADGEWKNLSSEEQFAQMAKNIQSRLNRAYGEGNVYAEVDTTSGALSFHTGTNATSSISISSSDRDMTDALGIVSGASNKLNVNATLDKANLGGAGIGAEQLEIGSASNGGYVNDDGSLDLVINGVKIKGLTGRSTINDIISKINSNSEVGVKASYIAATGQLSLVSSETGAGRQISADSALAQKLFMTDPNDPEAGFTEGKNAIVAVGYGDGTTIEMERSSNTFELEGLNISVTGTFGYVANGTDADGKTTYTLDSSQEVRFNAKADVDGVTELVSKFIEEYNALVEEINTQITTRPDSSYGPLSDDQKAEMSESEIEKWEEKAKKGLLFNNSSMRSLSTDIQSVFTNFMRDNNISYTDLEDIGITISENYSDGGKLVFDEAAFKQAMSTDPDKVADIFAGGDGVSTGFAETIQNTLTPYATRYASRNGGSYGYLIEEAGSEKVPLSVMDNYIYKEIEAMQDVIATLKERLATEQDRYIQKFSSMETLINQYNSQSSYLSQLQG